MYPTDLGVFPKHLQSTIQAFYFVALIGFLVRSDDCMFDKLGKAWWKNQVHTSNHNHFGGNAIAIN